MTATTTTPPRHECAVIGCHRPHVAKTLCGLHYSRMARGADLLAPPRARKQTRRVLEDAEWLAGTDTPERIATRLGFTSWPALQQLLWRHGRQDLAAAISARRELPKLGPWQVVA